MNGPPGESYTPRFDEVLVAKRGEMATRAFRAAFEPGARTVAVFPFEDRKSEHRLEADEAYEIGGGVTQSGHTSTRKPRR